MNTERIQHADKVVIRDASGRAERVVEHSWLEAAAVHAQHKSDVAATVARQDRGAAEIRDLRAKVAELDGLNRALKVAARVRSACDS